MILQVELGAAAGPRKARRGREGSTSPTQAGPVPPRRCGQHPQGGVPRRRAAGSAPAQAVQPGCGGRATTDRDHRPVRLARPLGAVPTAGGVRPAVPSGPVDEALTRRSPARPLLAGLHRGRRHPCPADAEPTPAIGRAGQGRAPLARAGARPGSRHPSRSHGAGAPSSARAQTPGVAGAEGKARDGRGRGLRPLLRCGGATPAGLRPHGGSAGTLPSCLPHRSRNRDGGRRSRRRQAMGKTIYD